MQRVVLGLQRVDSVEELDMRRIPVVDRPRDLSAAPASVLAIRHLLDFVEDRLARQTFGGQPGPALQHLPIRFEALDDFLKQAAERVRFHPFLLVGPRSGRLP
jgi:hypothetical protein